MNYAEYTDRNQSSDNIAATERCSLYIRKFEKQRENGLDGPLKQAEIVNEVFDILSGDFFFFLDAVGLNKSEGLHLMQIGKRIRQLHELLPDADNLGSFLLLHLILQDQQSFELALNSAPSISDIHAVQLLDDVLDSRQETGSLFNSAQIGFHYFEMKYPKYT